MVRWVYKTYSCSGDSVSETWHAFPDAGNTVCAELGCSAINTALAATIGQAPSKTNPGLSALLPGIGIPYKNRPCDPSADAALFLGPPSISQDSVQSPKNDDRFGGGSCGKEVTLTWSPLPESQRTEPPRETGSGDPDPDDWTPSVSGGSVANLVAASKLEFGGLYQLTSCAEPAAQDLIDIANSCLTMNKGDCRTPQTTAGQPFNPPLELEETDWLYRLMFQRRPLPGTPFDESVFKGFQNKPNTSAFTVQILDLWKATFEPNTVKAIEVGNNLKYQTTVNPVTGQRSRLYYMELQVTLAYRSRGWHIDVLNAGTTICPSAPGPSGYHAVVLGDANGETIDEPSLLDETGAATQEEWYSRWLLPDVELKDMPVLSDYTT